MGSDRERFRRRDRRAFRPSVASGLEPRFLLSQGGFFAQRPSHLAPVPFQTFHFRGGQGVRVVDSSGEFFDLHLVGGGVVRATQLSDGRVGIRVDGSGPDSVLSIDPVSPPHAKGLAHRFSFGQGTYSHMLNIGAIDVTSGQIFQILGYHTAVLSGPVLIGGDTPVDRIAFFQLLPGASISDGNDLNTFDVFDNATISGGPGIQVGRDLNWFNIGGNLTVENGANIIVNRDIGLVLQPAKGTDPGGIGGLIGGNLNIAPGSAWVIGRSVDSFVVIHGGFVDNTPDRIFATNNKGFFVAIGGP
jgi:hypothetical protein